MADTSLIGRSLGVTTAELEKGRLRFFAKSIGETLLPAGACKASPHVGTNDQLQAATRLHEGRTRA